MNRTILVAFALITPLAVWAQDEADSHRSGLSLLPRSLQKNVGLDVTVITEMSPAGKLVRGATPENPVYYHLISGGFRAHGDDVNETRLGPAQLEPALRRSLAEAGYREASPGHPPTLAIVFHWGSHNVLAVESPALIEKNFLERAALVGGQKFAEKVDKMLAERHDQEIAFIMASRNPDRMPFPPNALTFMNPFNAPRQMGGKQNFILDQAESELYFVVASAYDYSAMTQKRRLLLWRTSMTVDSSGVSQAEALPKLVAVAAPYFGKAMEEPEILSPRLKDGKVKVGTPAVVEPTSVHDE